MSRGPAPPALRRHSSAFSLQGSRVCGWTPTLHHPATLGARRSRMVSPADLSMLHLKCLSRLSLRSTEDVAVPPAASPLRRVDGLLGGFLLGIGVRDGTPAGQVGGESRGAKAAPEPLSRSLNYQRSQFQARPFRVIVLIHLASPSPSPSPSFALLLFLPFCPPSCSSSDILV